QKLDTIYHKVSDEFDPSWSWEGMRRHAQSAFLIGVHVGNRADMPVWNEGDPFNKPRKRAEAGS
ncbi:MAG: aminopeptidase, partial [Armatimonadetes bacterium]|nr:aminopeptidase [Armatimonadota bacterium]